MICDMIRWTPKIYWLVQIKEGRDESLKLFAKKQSAYDFAKKQTEQLLMDHVSQEEREKMENESIEERKHRIDNIFGDYTQLYYCNGQTIEFGGFCLQIIKMELE